MELWTKSGWRNVKTRRTVLWRGKRMTVTINRPCYFAYIVPQSAIYLSAAPADWRTPPHSAEES